MKKFFIFCFVLILSFVHSPLYNEVTNTRIQKIQKRYRVRNLKTSYEIKQILIKKGYSDIYVYGFEDGFYKATVTKPTGNRAVVLINPENANVEK